jgi:hypothetical protein
MNMMEVVSIYDPATGGGVFMADIDGGGNDGRVPPLQLTLCTRDGLSEIAGFSIADALATAPVVTPRLAVGVHTTGDWHAAVDFYVTHTARDLTAAHVPDWFRRQGALYSFSGGGAGGPFLAMPIVNLNDGAVWASFAVDGFWHPQRPPDGQPARVNFAMPLPITMAGAAPAGAPVMAVMRDDRQLDLFVVAPDGAVCTTFVVGDGVWDKRLHRLTMPGAAPPSAHLLAINRSPDQLDRLPIRQFG